MRWRYPPQLCSQEHLMQENRELMELNEHLTDAKVALAIRYLDPDLRAERTGKDASTLVGIFITLLTGLTGAIAYICHYIWNL
jgi:hypothetical protein